MAGLSEMTKLLLSAFEPFDGQALNPSVEAARAMAGVEFKGATVSTAGLALTLERGSSAPGVR